MACDLVGALQLRDGRAGTSSHLAVELFKSTTGTELQAVQYKGAAPGVSDLLGGRVQLMDSRPGADNIIGADACAKSNPDGYTFCMMPIDALVLNPFLFKSFQVASLRGNFVRCRA